MKVLVIIPTYNEAENIQDLLKSLSTLKIDGLDVLVIDDNSPDKTHELVKKISEENSSVNLIVRKNKEGIGGAYITGFEWGIAKSYDYFIQMDADFSHDPNDIIRLLHATETNNCDVVIGSRRVAGGTIVGWNFYRQFCSWSAHAFSRMMLALPYKDITAGYRLFSRETVKHILRANITSNGYAFQEEVLYKLHRSQKKIVEIPVTFYDRVSGKSKLGLREIIAFFRSIASLMLDDEKKWWLTPVYIFLIWRIALELTGRLVYVSALSPWLSDPYPPLWARWDSGWYSLIVRNGYMIHDGAMSNLTFFPLYPLLWKVVSLLGVPNFISGLIVSNILAFVGILIYYRWTLEAFRKKIALRALVALLVFPSSFFLITAYSESTLFFLSALFLLFAHRKKWFAAALLAACASAARPVGVLLWPTLSAMWLISNNFRPERKWKEILSIILLPPAGLILFSFYLSYTTGDSLAWLHGQSSAGRELGAPLKLIYAYCVNILSRGDYWLRHLSEIAALIFIVSLFRRLYRINPAFCFLALLNILPSLLSNTFTSIQRFVLMIVPIFVAIAQQRKFVFTLYVLICIPLLVLSISQFVNWRWAG